jgi:putative spermidine/putrescine transport system permease protein
MTAHAWRSPCLLLAAPVLFFAAFFLAPLAVVGRGRPPRGPHGRTPTPQPYQRGLAPQYHRDVIQVTLPLA